MRELNYLAISTDGGYVMFSTDKFFAIYSVAKKTNVVKEASLGGMRLVQNFGSSSALLLVPSGDKPGISNSPRRPKFWNAQARQIISEISFETAVEVCQWNKTFAVFLTDTKIIVYELAQIRPRVMLPRDPNNKAIALTADGDLLAYPSSEVGVVYLYSCAENRLLSKIPAHQSQLAHIAFSRNGKMIATVSKTGTIVRVFQVPGGELLHSYRISTVPVTITTLLFCPQSRYLICHSSSGVVWVCGFFPTPKLSPVAIPVIIEESEDDEDREYCRIDVPPPPQSATPSLADPSQQQQQQLTRPSSFSSQDLPLPPSSQSGGSFSDTLTEIWRSDAAQQIVDVSLQSLSTISTMSKAWITGKPLHRVHVDDNRLERPLLEASVGDDVAAVSLSYLHVPMPKELSESTTSSTSSISNGSVGTAVTPVESDGMLLKLMTATPSGVLRRYDVHIAGRTAEFTGMHSDKNKLVLDDEVLFFES